MILLIMVGVLSFMLFPLNSFCAVSEPDSSIVCGKTITTDNAIVVSADSIASYVGAQVLRKGGNAVDAAIAVGLALAVTYPRAGNIGGGGFLLLRVAAGTTHFIDYREKAPLQATRDMYLDENGEVIEDASTEGHLAVGVPGTIAGFWFAHQRFGTLPWRELVEPACRLARDGFPATVSLIASINKYKDFLSSNEATKQLFVEPGLTWGDLFVQPELARTLERIRDKGPEGFYFGETADLIVSEMEANGGLISYKDLAEYRAVFRLPIKFVYRHYEIIGAPLPSSGGVIIGQVLQLMESSMQSETAFHSAEHVHAMSEAEKIAYRIRALYLGDDDFYSPPWRSLIDWSHIKKLHSMLDPSRALTVAEIDSMDLEPASWKDFGKRKPESREMRQQESESGRPEDDGQPFYESDHTTHYSIVDQWGNAVANTYTLNGSFGCGVTVPGAGFLLNNEMDDFSIKPGHPNLYGLVGSEANAIQPRKRMLSSMSPTIVLERGSLYMVAGSPGGSRIPTSVLQVISNVIDFDMTLEDAVSAKRVHAQYLPDEIRIEENALSADVIQVLEAMGHNVITKKDMGDIQAIRVLHGLLEAASDPRGWGRAAGY
jgi:gamma-glutamyltranspeptidase/glutathione hydrolase